MQRQVVDLIPKILRDVVETLELALVAVDAKGHVLASNDAAAVLFRPGDDRSGAARDVLLPDVGEALAAMLASGATSSDGAIQLHTSEGPVIPLTATSAALEAEAGRLFLFRDERVDREIRNLREIDAQKSEFVLGLLHDMKTPLTGIISGCDLLGVMLEDAGNDELEVLRVVRASADRLQSLALDLLEISALESAATLEAMEDADLVEIVRTALDPIRLQMTSHCVRFESGESALALKCRPRRIARVLENLVSNAVKYSPDGTEITVRVERDGAMATLAVSDHGVGIAESDLPHIWDRYRRGDRHLKSVIEGTGLGLSITKMIVDRHNGRIEVDSRDGEGATFTVSLPLAQPARA